MGFNRSIFFILLEYLYTNSFCLTKLMKHFKLSQRESLCERVTKDTNKKVNKASPNLRNLRAKSNDHVSLHYSTNKNSPATS